MENSKTYKLYKSGKLWVIGAVAVAGVAVSANTTKVSADTVSSTAEKSTVQTTAGSNVTQDQAKDSVDKAQETVKNDADTASKAGVDVTTGKTTDVTINDDNASSKTDEVLSDLNKQDQAVKDATVTPATPATPKAVETASILPHTNANEQGSGAVLGFTATIASLGLLGAISKKLKKQN